MTTSPLAEDSTTVSPRNNPNLLGQTSAEATLLKAHKSGRLPHAWLFAGQKGIGKATLAFRFARYLLANDGLSSDAELFGDIGDNAETLHVDANHPVFRRIAAESHGDLRVLERKEDKKGRLRSSIVVDDVRGATDFLHRTSGDGGWRIVIVDAAEDLNNQATNALLKALEEPSDQTLLILISHAPGRLLPTVHSRCCHLTLGQLSEGDLSALIARFIPEAAVDEAQALARLSGGSIGKALALRQAGGLGLLQDLAVVLESMPRLDILKAQTFVDHVVGPKDATAFETLRELLAWWFARMLRSGATQTFPPPVLANERELMVRMYNSGDLEAWMAFWDKWSKLLSRADNTAANRRQMMLGLFADLSRLVA
ncbi:DNA polymerase III subunit delta' [Limibacillus sp. MBR-115]|jgi:DNA polymerase-3 subunit delta'|uniref:DNA polymerase III subunit delta' n=1 Tax=Limibacillus sp. MBR-115 TaxID=3156465 RepID=UPI00339B4616